MSARRHPPTQRTATRTPPRSIRDRVADLDWKAIAAGLDADGYARVPRLLSGPECRELIALYPDAARFRSRIDMGPRRFGEGEAATAMNTPFILGMVLIESIAIYGLLVGLLLWLKLP